MRSADEHLTPQELQDLLIAAAEPNVTSADRSNQREAQQHLDGCDVCKGMASKYAKAQSLLRVLSPQKKSLQQSDASRRRRDCPPDETWLRLAAGLIDDAAASPCVSHAVDCDRCGVLLRESMQVMADDITADEEAAIDGLRSADADWQRQLGQKLAAAARPEPVLAEPETPATPAEDKKTKALAGREKNEFSWWPRFAVATVGLVAVVVAGSMVWERLNPNPDTLLANAYTAQRTLELRIPNAKYGRINVQRGTEGSRMNRPTELLDAESLIAHRLATHPDDPKVLQMRGRAELLDWKYEAAIETLKQSLDLDSRSSSIKLDLASAYFERAEDLDRPIDYRSTIDLLGQVLAQKPDDPVALFNRAITYERMFMYHDAMEDWEHYLRIDNHGAWADEARQRYEDLRKKVREHDQRSAAPLLPSRRFDQSISAANESTWKFADERIEDYLDLAVTYWLPAAFPASGAVDVDSQAALVKLMKVLEKRHQDPWLKDLMAARPTSAFASALAGLSQAVRENSKGLSGAARIDSIEAAKQFRRAGSRAGYLRAELELAYALHRSGRGADCLRLASTLAVESAARHDAWIESQSLLEQAVCSGMENHWDSVGPFSRKAVTASLKHGYPTLYLRALAFSATAEWSTRGNLAEAWAIDRKGLSYFWDGNFPWLRAYTFYQDLSVPAEQEGYSETTFALRQEALAIDAMMDDQTRHAIAHLMLGKAAASAGKTIRSRQEFLAADAAFDTLPVTASNQNYKLYGDIQLAELAIEQGAFETASKLLDQVHGELRNIQNTQTEATFFNVVGLLDQKKGLTREAESSFRSAIELSKKSFGSISTEADRESAQRILGASYRSLVSLKISEKLPEEAWIDWQEYHGWNSTTLSPSSISHPASVPREEDHDSPTMIAYAVLKEGVAIWAVDDKGLSSAFVNVDSKELERMIRRFDEQCASPKSSIGMLRYNAQQLYAWLISPVASKLHEGGALTIYPDSVLAQVPMEALVDDRGRYLGDRFAVTYTSWRPLPKPSSGTKTLSSETAALVVNVAFSMAAGPELIPIPDSRREADAIASMFAHPYRLEDREATWLALKRRLPHAAVLHFTGHALARAGHTSLLLISPSGTSLDPVGPDRFATVNLSTLQLVVLAGCSTGKVDEDGFGSLDTLVGVFLDANVPNVVAARWNVDSAETSLFMKGVYQSLFNRATTARAVQSAARRVRSKDPGNSHPYFWAGFSAFGRQ